MRRFWPFRALLTAARSTDHPSSALNALLAALDSAAGNGSGPAAAHAHAIRRDGAQAADKLLAEAATHVRSAKAMLATPVIAAAARYDRTTTGADWSALPSEHVRARQVLSLEDVIERRRRREAAALARIRERADSRNLARLRAATERTTR